MQYDDTPCTLSLDTVGSESDVLAFTSAFPDRSSRSQSLKAHKVLWVDGQALDKIWVCLDYHDPNPISDGALIGARLVEGSRLWVQSTSRNTIDHLVKI